MITYRQAIEIISSALNFGDDQPYPPMTVAVLDAGGHLVAFGRQDGSSLLREQIARAKAAGALNMGVGSRALASRADSHPQFFNALITLAGGALVPVPGGVLVRDAGGAVIGAVGVSGHLPDADEACAIRGIKAASLTADPGE